MPEHTASNNGVVEVDGNDATYKSGLIQRLQAELQDVERQLRDIEELSGFGDSAHVTSSPQTPPRQSRQKSRHSLPPQQQEDSPSGDEPQQRSRGRPQSAKERPQSAKERPAPESPQLDDDNRQVWHPSSPAATSDRRPSSAAGRTLRRTASASAERESQSAPDTRPGTAQPRRMKAKSKAGRPLPTDIDSMTPEQLDAAVQAARQGEIRPFKARPVPASVRKSGSRSPSAEPGEGIKTSLPVDKASVLSTAHIKSLAKEPLFQAALVQCGFTLADILPKSREELVAAMHHGHRADLPAVQEQYYAHVESKRQADLQQVLQVACIIEQKQAAAAELAAAQQEAVAAALRQEAERRAKAERQAARMHQVLAQENEVLMKKRQEFEAKLAQLKERDDRLAAERAAAIEERKKRAAERQAQQDAIRMQKEQREAERLAQLQRKLHDKEARNSYNKQAQMTDTEMKRHREAEREAYRQRVKEQAEAAAALRYMERKQRREEKEAAIAAAREAAAREMDERKEEMFLKHLDKADNVQRLQRQMEFERERMRQKVAAKEERIQTMKELQEAVQRERQLERKKALVAKHQFEQQVQLARHATPGPGEYAIPSMIANGGAGAIIAQYKPKSDVDWAIKRASEIPGPGQYAVENIRPSVPSATFGNGHVPTDLEWKMMRAAEVPGPNAYDVGRTYQPDTPAFSMGNFKPKSDLEWQMLRASEIPGPGQYGTKSEFKPRPRTVLELQRTVQRSREQGSMSPPRSPSSRASRSPSQYLNGEGSVFTDEPSPPAAVSTRERGRELNASGSLVEDSRDLPTGFAPQQETAEASIVFATGVAVPPPSVDTPPSGETSQQPSSLPPTRPAFNESVTEVTGFSVVETEASLMLEAPAVH